MGGRVLKLLAISLAVLSAVALAVGSQLQNGAVGIQKKAALSGRSHFTFRQLLNLIRHPQWVTGLFISIVALALQFTALLLAPLILVQPIGAIALVLTSILNSRITKTPLNALGAFVVMAHEVAVEPAIDDNALIYILALVISLIAIGLVVQFKGAANFKPLTFIVGAGVLFGFVATLTKVVLKRLFSQGGYDRIVNFRFELLTDGLTLLALVCLVVAGLLGGWFVQNAYTSGPPDLVVAGLTVIDPLVAVSIGVVVLNEAMNASVPIMVGFLASGAVAVVGVYLLSKVHPELIKRA
ncbi:MAG: multidrug DMT transporter permease [Micrococcales bacterium]|nr:multidrug DMT transporter permease [Micrococcales bacterium]